MKLQAMKIYPKDRATTILKAILAFLGGIIFCIGSFFALIAPRKSGDLFMGIVGTLLFGAASFLAPFKILSEEYMILTSKGIELYTGKMSTCIFWSDIEKIEITSVLSNQRIGVILKNVDRYIHNFLLNRLAGGAFPFQKKDKTDYDLTISSDKINKSVEDFFALLEKYKKAADEDNEDAQRQFDPMHRSNFDITQDHFVPHKASTDPLQSSMPSQAQLPSVPPPLQPKPSPLSASVILFSSSIHVNRDGINYGPYEAREAELMYIRGNILKTDLVWHEGMSEWRPAGGFFLTSQSQTSLSPTPPPLPFQ
jgi:hypothetical protein